MQSAWLRKKLNLTTSIALFASLILPGISQAEEAKLSLSPGLVSIIRVPNWVAQNEGLFKKNGLDIYQCVGDGDVKSLKNIANIDVPMDVRCKTPVTSPISVMGGSPTFLGHFEINDSGRVQPKRVTLMTIQNRTNYALIARKDIQFPEQLKGKKIAVTSPYNIMGFQALLFLQAMQWQPGKDVEIVVEPSGYYNGLETGKFDAFMAGEGLPLWQALQKGYKPLVDYRFWGIPMASSSVNVDEAWLKDNRETMRKFIKSLVEAIALIKQDRNVAYRAMTKFYGMTDPKMLEYFYNTWDIPAKPYPAVDGLRIAQKLYANYPGLRNDELQKVKVEDYVDNSFIRELDESGYIDSLYKKKK